MNVQAPVSTIMTTHLYTVGPKDKLMEAKKIFDSRKIHHIPVVNKKEILGMVSLTDLLYFLKGMTDDSYEKVLNDVRLNNYTVEEIMTTGLAKLNSTDRISVALDIFEMNLFHVLPVVDNEELVGIVSTHDIITSLANEKVPNS